MKLQSAFLLYLVVIHLLFAAASVVFLLEHPVWLFAVEVLFILSFAAGIRLQRAYFEPLGLIEAGADFLRERDFSARLRTSGRPEMDRLIEVYNTMIQQLREERLRVREQHYFLDRILHDAPFGILIFDVGQRISFVNPGAERILHSSAAELQGRRVQELEGALGDSLRMLHSQERKVVAQQGGRRFRYTKSQFIDSGFPREYVLIEELTEELRQSEKAAYEKLIRMVAHEVNNSIGAATSLLHSMLHYAPQLQPDDRQDFSNAVRVVISRAEHLNAFMKKLADIVRLPEPQRQACRLHDLLQRVATLFSAACRRQGIVLEIALNEETLTVPLDVSQMEQVFVNVVKNAVEAIHGAGRIELSCGLLHGRRYARVWDNGAGISPDVQARLFTPFFTSKEGGQGIGLTLVREILRLHDFEFTLESQSGGPTLFTVYFD